MDEADKKGLTLDLEELSRRLETPVVAAAARSGRGLEELLDAVEVVCGKKAQARRRRTSAHLDAAPGGSAPGCWTGIPVYGKHYWTGRGNRGTT